MKQIIVLLILLCTGCKSIETIKKSIRVESPPGFANVDASRFEKTVETAEERTRQTPLVSVRFDNVALKDAMKMIGETSGAAIAWDSAIDNEIIVGNFVDQPLSDVLDTIARRCKVSVSEKSGTFYLGEYRSQDRASAIVRIPPIDRTELVAALEGKTSENGKCSLVGSFIWISDTFDNIRNIIEDIEELRKRSERSYLAEVYFIRVNEDDFVQLTGDLRIKSIDVFSSAFNIEELFEMFVDADLGITSASVDTRPVLYLSEGRKANLKVGSEIVRERKAVNERGVIETVGYDKFTDGIDLTLQLNRSSNERYSIDLELEISTFDRGDSNLTIPAKKNSVLNSPGLLLKDGGIVYAGSLTRKDSNKNFGLFSLNGSKLSDVLTIWVRVREIK